MRRAARRFPNLVGKGDHVWDDERRTVRQEGGHRQPDTARPPALTRRWVLSRPTGSTTCRSSTGRSSAGRATRPSPSGWRPTSSTTSTCRPGLPFNPWPRTPHPDVQQYSFRDYGNRVGFWRMLEVLDRYGVRCSTTLNIGVLSHFPEVAEAMLARDWTFVNHGFYNTRAITDFSEGAGAGVLPGDPGYLPPAHRRKGGHRAVGASC